MSDLEGNDSIGITAWFKDLTYAEVHLAAMGLYAGFVAIRPKRRQIPNIEGFDPDTAADKWYYRGMYVIGYVLKIGLLLLLGKDLGFFAV
jgi:hypothetical protein